MSAAFGEFPLEVCFLSFFYFTFLNLHLFLLCCHDHIIQTNEASMIKDLAFPLSLRECFIYIIIKELHYTPVLYYFSLQV